MRISEVRVREHCYLIAKGVRPLALVDCRSKESVEMALGISYGRGCFNVKAKYYWVSDNMVRAVVYREGCEKEAVELAELMTTMPRNHKRVGELLGYHPDIIWDE